MVLSVGELNDNKNHASVIKAIAGMDLTYVIVGKGDKKEELQQLAEENKVDLRLTGFRTDVADFYDAADVYVLPSIREGLNVSLMEAMASGLACCCGNIRGNIDLLDEKDGVLFCPEKTDEIRKAIETALNNKVLLGRKNLEKIKSFSVKSVNKMMEKVYSNIVEDNEE